MTVAYSYIRFSTPQQVKGDSLRRQLSKSEKFAAKHGLTLDTSLRDMGLSAFKGAHRIKGALASFLAKIESGEIERGSYLIVENLDRLSREQVLEALTLFLSIINAGVVVVTLNDDMIYSRESIAERPNDLLISIGGMIKGNRESADKADRLQEVWQEKRDQLLEDPRRKLTRQGPGWLDLIPDDPKEPLVGEWRLNDRAPVVRRIFQLCIAGLGKEAIARRLNSDDLPSFKHGDGWSASTVGMLLTDRRVIGELQLFTKVGGPRRPTGEPIKGYFATDAGETVISEDVFYLAQSEIAKRHCGAQPGRRNKVPNILIGIARCQCGRRMEFRDKRTRNSNGPKAVYLICSGAQRQRACANDHHFTYSETERLVLDWVSDIIVHDDETNREETVTKLAVKIAERDDLKRRVQEGLTKWATATITLIKDSLMLTAERDAKTLEKVEGEVAELERAVSLTKRSVSDERRATVRRLRGQMEGLNGEALFEMRAKLAAALRQAIDHIYFERDDRFSVTLKGGLKLYRFANGRYLGAFDLNEVNPGGEDKLLLYPSAELIAAAKLDPMTVAGMRDTLTSLFKAEAAPTAVPDGPLRKEIDDMLLKRKMLGWKAG